MICETKILEGFNSLADSIESYYTKELPKDCESFYKAGANGSKEIVTEADRQIEEICLKFFLSHFPSVPVLTEESYIEESRVHENGWMFIVDPIDGTSEFVKGSDEWTVSLAAVKNTSPRVGMLFLPHKKLRFSAVSDGYVLCNGQRMTPSLTSDKEKRIGVSPRQIHISEYADKIKKTGFRGIEVSTLTMKIVAILLGQVDAAVYFPQEGKSANLWDYAAALLLVERFGGRMTSLDGNEMPFTKESIIHRNGWLASNAFCNHADILKALW